MQSSTNSCWKYFCALSYSQQDLLCFQQDGTTAHTAEISMQVLRTMFLANSFPISGTLPGLPDHAVPDQFLWVYVKSEVYEICPANILS